MGMIKVPYLIPKPSGFYWQPKKAMRALGFAPEALGKDPIAAAAKAAENNRKVAAVKAAIAAKQAGEDPAGILLLGTYADLIDIYRGNDERAIPPSRPWRHLTDSSRAAYGSYLRKIRARWGDMMVADTTPEAIEAVQEAMADRPSAANTQLAVLSELLKIAIARPSRFGLADNPAEKVRYFGVKDGVAPRQQYWSDADETAFLGQAEADDWEIFVGYHLLVYTGQRPGDVRKMAVTDYDGEKIQVAQQKTGARVWIPAHRDLKAVLARHAERRRAEGRVGGTLLQNPKGRKFGITAFADRWNAVAEAAGIEGLQRRDLRRTKVVRMADAGCTIPEIAAITGHSVASVDDILRTYLVRTYPQAQAAIRKLEEYRSRGETGTGV